jgi:hypothetical protein
MSALQRARVVVLLLALVGHAIVAAQTRSEAEAWIVEQAANNVAGLTYAIDGDDLVRRLQMPSPLSSGVVQQTIPIRRITRIEVTHTEKYLSYTLSCDEPCVEQLTEGVADDSDPRRKRPVLLFEIYRRLDASFPPRMNKALLKLVELHGGKAKVVEKAKPKAPF